MNPYDVIMNIIINLKAKGLMAALIGWFLVMAAVAIFTTGAGTTVGVFVIGFCGTIVFCCLGINKK